MVADCAEGFQRCSDTTVQCVPQADVCDTITDCAAGEDEEFCEGFTQCLNGGTRVDDVVNVCNCPDRYNGTLCNNDLGKNNTCRNLLPLQTL